jgi:ABC-type polysaccharide/polyol phosphate export permease
MATSVPGAASGEASPPSTYAENTRSTSSLFQMFVRHRDLLYMLTSRDITVKYKQSVMGLLWAILMPLLVSTAGVLVKAGLAHLAHRPVQVNEVLAVTVRALPWSFFVSSIRFSTASLSGNAHLVTKVAFPRMVFPLSAVASQLFDFAIASVVVVAGAVIAGVGVRGHILWVPVLLLMMVAQAAGLALLLSAANLFYRDVKYLVEILITFGIFFTPVFYDVDLFGPLGHLLFLNPLAPIIVGFSDAVVAHRSPELGWLLYSGCVSASLAFIAPRIFRAVEPKFAECV